MFILTIDKEQLEQIDSNKELNNRRKELLKDRLAELVKVEKALKKVMDAYENDAYTLEQFLERKKPHDESIKSLKKEIAELQREDEYKSKYSTSQMKRKIEWFKREWAKVSNPKDQNILLKSIVKKIYYDRNGDSVTLDIEYN